MSTFQELLSEMHEEMELQYDRLDHLTTCNFDWLDKLLYDLQNSVLSEESEQQETQIETSNQTESMILPISNNCLTLVQQMDVFNDILSSEEDSNSSSVNHHSENEENYHINENHDQKQMDENAPGNTNISLKETKLKRPTFVTTDILKDNGSSTESLLSLDSNLSTSHGVLSTKDQYRSITKTYEMSEYASELATSAQKFRQKWKESLQAKK